METIAPPALVVNWPLAAAPTCAVELIAALHGAIYREVLDWIELDAALTGQNHLPWAWNMSARLNHRRFIRVLSQRVDGRASLETVLPLLFTPRAHAGLHGALRREARFVTGVQFQRAFCCSPQLVAALVAAGELSLLQRRPHLRGAGSSPKLTLDSITAFLLRRRM